MPYIFLEVFLNRDEFHTKIGRLHLYTNPKVAELPVVSDFTERFLCFAS